jgi:hypothetical protein
LISLRNRPNDDSLKEAVASMKEDGSLQQIAERWFDEDSSTAKAPELSGFWRFATTNAQPTKTEKRS